MRNTVNRIILWLVLVAMPVWAQPPQVSLTHDKPTTYPSILNDLDAQLQKAFAKTTPKTETLYGVNTLVVKWQIAKFMVHQMPMAGIIPQGGHYDPAQEIEGPDAKGFALEARLIPRETAAAAKRKMDSKKSLYWNMETRSFLVKSPDSAGLILLVSLATGSYIERETAESLDDAILTTIKNHADFASAVCSNQTLAPLEVKLKTLLAQQIPSEELEVEDLERNGFKIGYRTHKLTVYLPLMTGELQRPLEEVGPRIKGFEISVWIDRRRSISQSLIPQDIRYAYWNTFINAYSLKDKNSHLWINLKHDQNSKMSKNIEFEGGLDKLRQTNPLLDKIEQTIAEFAKDTP